MLVKRCSNMLYRVFIFHWLLWPNDRNTPKSTEKVPINLADMQHMLELLKLMAKFIGTTKGQNLQNSWCSSESCQEIQRMERRIHCGNPYQEGRDHSFHEDSSHGYPLNSCRDKDPPTTRSGAGRAGPGWTRGRAGRWRRHRSPGSPGWIYQWSHGRWNYRDYQVQSSETLQHQIQVPSSWQFLCTFPCA